MSLSENSTGVERAVEVLRAGGIIAYPTEAVFGLGCLPAFEQSIIRLLELKQRPSEKGLILVAADQEQLDNFVDFDSVPDFDSVSESWPGPVTWLVPAKSHISPLLRGDSSKLAVRVSAHPLIQELCRAVGPIISTSANRNAEAPALSAEEVFVYFQDSLDFILDATVGNLSSPTQIRDAISGEIVRPSVA